MFTENLKKIIQTHEGILFVGSLLIDCGVLGQPDLSEHTAGRRSVGLQIIAEMSKIDPKLYHETMIKFYKIMSEQEEAKDAVV